MIDKINILFQKVLIVLKTYPLVLLTSLIVGILSIVGFEYEGDEMQFYIVKSSLIGCWGIGLFFAAKMLHQRRGKGWIWDTLAFLLMVLLYWILPNKEDAFTPIHSIIIFVSMVLSHLLVSFVPFVEKEPEINFWQYNKSLFVNSVLTVIFTGVLVGGILLAILAIDQLFGIETDYSVYMKSFLFLSNFGSTLIFLLFCNSGLKHLEQKEEYPSVLKFFTQFVLIPLLIIYTIILYAYSAKIIMQWELPRGWVSYLILAYSIVGILALLLVHPLKENHSKSWVKLFSKIFYYALIPLLGLLYVAIFTRVLAYGFTEPRYYVLLLAIWLTVVAVYFIIAAKPSIKFIPISMFVFGLSSLVLPYFNAFSVSVRSQKDQFVKILEQNQLLEKGVINFDKRISLSVVYDISDEVYFLQERNEKEWIKKYIDKKHLNQFNDSYSVASLFANTYSEEGVKGDDYYTFYLTSKRKIIDLENYQYMLEGSLPDKYQIGEDVIQINNEGNIVLNGKETLNIKSLIKEKYFSSLPSKTGKEVEMEKLFVDGDLGKYQVRIVFHFLNYTRMTTEDIYYSSFVLIKERE